MLQTQDTLEVLRALNALQIKSGRPVFSPDRDLIDEEVQVIEQLQIIFRTGRLKASWDSITTDYICRTKQNRRVAPMVGR